MEKDNPIYLLCEEFKELSHFYDEVKNELDGMISLMLEEVFDDFVCINSWCYDDVIYFEIDEKHREITKQQLKEVENITNSKNFVDFNFMIESGRVFE